MYDIFSCNSHYKFAAGASIPIPKSTSLYSKSINPLFQRISQTSGHGEQNGKGI